MSVNRDLYLARLNVYGIGTRDYNIKPIKKQVNSMFNIHNPSYKPTLIVNNDTSTKGAIIIDDDDGKKILRRPGETLGIGDTIEWNGYWLCTEIDRDTDIYPKGLLDYCNNTLTFMIDNVVYNTPCIFSKSISQNSDGTDKSTVNVNAESILNLKIQNTYLNRKIPLNMRFIFDKSKHSVYELKSIDISEKSGLMSLKLSEDTYNPSVDRLDLNLANYTKQNPASNPSGNLF